jgi:hypothetical protein
VGGDDSGDGYGLLDEMARVMAGATGAAMVVATGATGLDAAEGEGSVVVVGGVETTPTFAPPVP